MPETATEHKNRLLQLEGPLSYSNLTFEKDGLKMSVDINMVMTSRYVEEKYRSDPLIIAMTLVSNTNAIVWDYPDYIIQQTRLHYGLFFVISVDFTLSKDWYHFLLCETITTENPSSRELKFKKPLNILVTTTYISRKVASFQYNLVSPKGKTMVTVDMLYGVADPFKRSLNTFTQDIIAKSKLLGRDEQQPQPISIKDIPPHSEQHPVVAGHLNVVENNIDINNHANVSFYLVAPLLVFGKLHCGSRKIRKFRVSFKGECNLGDCVETRAWMDRNVDGKVYCSSTKGGRLVSYTEADYHESQDMNSKL